MSANPEQPVLDAIDELDSSHEPRDRDYDRCHMCGREWHGLPRYNCVGHVARQGAIEAHIGRHYPAAHRGLLRSIVDVGFYVGPEDHLERILDGRPLPPLEDDRSLWTIRPFSAPGVVPRGGSSSSR